ncbi:MAG: hypothetical protein JW932_18020 [Deltaproteobacteria bacterium]|nr:hypothetical protein [Deltaproteobacteria bacterium]
MKITNADVIKTGEQELIDAITADLDWGVIEEIFRKEHKLGIEEEIEYKKGDIVAYNNQVAYRLEFEVKVNLAVLLNRDGEYISINISGDEEEISGHMEDLPSIESIEAVDEDQNDGMDLPTNAVEPHESAVAEDIEPHLNEPDKEDDDNAFKEALARLDSMDTEEDIDSTSDDSSNDETPDKISRLASRVSKLMKKEKKA